MSSKTQILALSAVSSNSGTSSEVDHVALIKYTQFIVHLFGLFILDTEGLYQEKHWFLDVVEEHHGFHIKFKPPGVVEVQALVRNMGLFSIYQDELTKLKCCSSKQPEDFWAYDTGQRASHDDSVIL